MKIGAISPEAAWTIRHQVMWPDKPLDYVKLKDDDRGSHWGLFIENRLVSVVSLFIDGRRAQFRKFATLQQEQGKGCGSKLLRHVFEEARLQGADQIWCNARAEKAGFYNKFGLAASGEAFEKDGVSYVIMQASLTD